MSREGSAKNWERLVREFGLTHDEQDRIHRHLGRNYSVEKDYMSYEELKAAASDVVSRIS